MERERLASWLSLQSVPGVGDVLFRRLIERFGSPGAVFSAGLPELISVDGISHAIAKTIRSGIDIPDLADQLERIERSRVDFCTLTDADYPERVLQIHDPPPILYMRGRLLPEDQRAVAIVGSRRCTEYGRSVAYRLGWELASRGFTVVSGLARGIDAAAHQGALAVGGRTVGVLGCGLDINYPAGHADLKQAVSRQGAVLSEFPLGTGPAPENFPKRNRVISGLSLGVVVVEATETSGALITSSAALEQGREVFAVPGPIGSKTSKGSHKLIKQGAKMVEGVEDILEEFSFSSFSSGSGFPAEEISSRVEPALQLSSSEKKVFGLLSQNPQHVDYLTAGANLSPSVMAGLLLQLELKGVARQLAGQRYIRT